MIKKVPRFYKWGEEWSFGWLTGINKDLVSIKPNISKELKEPGLSAILSPVCSNWFFALLGFLLLLCLLRIDHKAKVRLEG
jgi:hypothetical protein